MKRLRGPQLKMPTLKVPTFLEDVWWDLRERGLLPLVGLIVVAIVAVPILLGGGSSGEQTPAGAEAGTAFPSVAGESAKLTVVQAKPGLRDYRRRLAGRTATDPFRQRYTAPVLKNAKLNPITETTTSTTVTTGGNPEVTTGGNSEPTPSTGGNPGGASPGESPAEGGEPSLTYFAFAAEIKLVRSGGRDSKSHHRETNVRPRVMPETPLPGDKAEVVTYMGVSKKGKALFLVSTHVKSVFGEVHCVMGDDVCQLVEVDEGFPVIFVYGANETHYTINVLKVEPIVTGHN